MKDSLQKPWLTTLLSAIVIVLVVVPSLAFLLRDFLPQTSTTSLGTNAFAERSAAQAAMDAKSTYPIVVDEFPYPEYIERYEYVYEGELPDLSAIDPTVYRRVDAFTLPRSISDAFSGLTLGIVPLSGFKDIELLNFSLAQADKTGFNIYLDNTSNAVTISRNEGYWSTLDYRTLSADDIPTDETLIAKADQFLRDYGIDVSAFGEPAVSTPLDPSWVPDSMSVVYPLIVNGEDVWSEWGQPSGLQVSVSLRTGEIDSAWIPGPSSVESSTYTLVTDPETVLEVAKRGGLWGSLPENSTVTYTFKLGEPEIILTEHYQYNEQEASTLYAPALRFPVIEKDPDAPYQQGEWIIVPLVQQFLDEAKPTELIAF